MDVSKMDFWSGDETDLGATESEICEAERELRVRLPSEYRDLLKLRNGGNVFPLRCRVDAKTVWGDGWAGLDQMDGVRSGRRPGMYFINDNAQVVEEWDWPQGLVAIAGSVHQGFMLDYRGSVEAKVTYFGPDFDLDECVASSFAEFLSLLEPFP